ncbi:hypothetical protein LCGC14_1491820 [marine sediment metagenome]|uniref:Uncharacterized protein n=1 Tax=marine sediment metagenome TaxID=412755 RepID=A0A0F9M889_9ZZZZ
MSQRQRIELPITEEQLDAMLENSYCQGHGSRDGEVERLRGAIASAVAFLYAWKDVLLTNMPEDWWTEHHDALEATLNETRNE